MKSLKIKNPTSPRHLVRLNANQKIELVISDPDVSVIVSGNFLKNTSIGLNDKKERVFFIEPVKAILKHSDVSTHYLGEVIVGTKTSVIVYLEPSNSRRNIVSVINPFNDSIRIRPFNIVEFIYCSDYDQKLIWTWELKEDIDLVEVDYKKSKSGVIPDLEDDVFCAHPRDVFINDATVHHFWFKLDRGLLIAMQDKPQKDLYVGRLAIEGADSGEDYDDCYVDVYCDLIPKWRMKTIDFMTGKQFSISETTHRGQRRYYHKQMKVDFELMPTKSVYTGCQIMEVKV